jgi:transposase
MPQGDDGYRGPTPDSDKYRNKEWLHEQYVERGASLTAIADLCGVTTKTISNWVDRFGFDKRDEGGYGDDAKHRNETWLREEYVEKERSLYDLAEDTTVSADTIRRWLGRYDIETRDPGNPNDEKSVYDTGRFQRLREEVINRDGGECVHCGTGRKEHLEKFGTDIHVHHKTPIKDGGAKYDADNLITICKSCHSSEHADESPPWLE